jgi:hypothetical protein
MKTLILGIATLLSASAFAYDVNHCGQVKAIITGEKTVRIVVRDEKGNDYSTPVSKKIESQALALAPISMQNKKLTFCSYVTSNEITDVSVLDFNP